MWTRMVAITLLQVVEEELCQHVLLGALLFVLRRPRGSGARAGGRSGARFGGGRLRGRGSAAQRVRIGEEALLHLVSALAQDHRLHVVLGAHLLERVGGLHLRQQPDVVVARFHLDEPYRAGEREALLFPEDGQYVAVHLDAPLLRPLVEHGLGYEQVVGHGCAGILAALRSSYPGRGLAPTDSSGDGCAQCIDGRADGRQIAGFPQGADRMASVDVVVFTDDNFQSEVLGSKDPVLVDFWAAWCGPCRAIAPLVDQLASEYKGKLKVGKLDIDAHQNVPQKYGVMSIPTLLLFKNGQVADQIVGAVPKSKLDAMVKRSI